MTIIIIINLQKKINLLTLKRATTMSLFLLLLLPPLPVFTYRITMIMIIIIIAWEKKHST